MYGAATSDPTRLSSRLDSGTELASQVMQWQRGLGNITRWQISRLVDSGNVGVFVGDVNCKLPNEVVWCCLSTRSTHPITMSLEAARDFSIPDLLHVLNEKIGLEFTTLRNTSLPPAVSAASLESEVSES